jgi:HPt (histidine-containing phosphotransfer) domain-containing protein
MPSDPDPNKSLISSYQDDPEMGTIVQEFVGELPARMEALAAAWRGRKLDDLRRMAHQLKGCSAGYGFPSIGTAAAAIEQRLQTLDASGIEERLPALAADIDRLIDLCSKAARG